MVDTGSGLFCSLCTHREREHRDISELEFWPVPTLDLCRKGSISYVLDWTPWHENSWLVSEIRLFGMKYVNLGAWEIFPYLQPRNLFSNIYSSDYVVKYKYSTLVRALFYSMNPQSINVGAKIWTSWLPKHRYIVRENNRLERVRLKQQTWRWVSEGRLISD